MSKRKEKLILLLVDFLTINGAWVLYYFIRIKSGWISLYVAEPELLRPLAVVYVYWLLLFLFFGLYRSWYAHSRFDEFATVFKTVTFGTLVLFFIVFVDDTATRSPVHSRLLILIYWFVLLVVVGTGRMAVRSFQRHLLEAGIGVRNSLIVGWSDKARELYDMVKRYPALGYRVIGFVRTDSSRSSSTYRGVPILGSIETIQQTIADHDVREVLIALDSGEHDKLLRVIERCDSQQIGLKIVPDLYDIISGQARTNQIYGFPLIEIMPRLMPAWEKSAKRLIDIVVSLLILLVLLPFSILIAILIRLESKGPIFYVQDRVGKDGKIFKMLKFRSMYHEAEKHSGPVWANRRDPRVTKVGRIIRKAHFDEVPQLVNVLEGDMSLVGPRPERPYFVEQLSREIPIYYRRLRVRPGLTGWAQVKHKYDESVDDVRVKLRYDLFYIENISLRMDMKILLTTIYTVLLGKGH
jgi:exopolysaccharide biosynthesis polyprenyl glycosylphosphotransferase